MTKRKKLLYTIAIAVFGVLGYNLLYGVLATETKVTETKSPVADKTTLDLTETLDLIKTETIEQGEVASAEQVTKSFVYTVTELESMESARDPFKVQTEVDKIAKELKNQFEQAQKEETPIIVDLEPEVELTETTEQTEDPKTTIEEEIVYQSNKYGIDPQWAKAIIQAESNYDQNAINENKDTLGVVTSVDKGLMQINSKTAPWIAKKLELPYTEDMELGPKINIEMGIFYLNYLKNISSDLDFIFTAYNRGPSGANNYKEQNGTYVSDYSTKIKQLLENND